MSTKAKSKDDGFTIRNFFVDDSGKKYLIIKQNDKLISLSLKLPNENKNRFIGTVTKSTKTMEMRRNRTKHLHRLTNSYGFNDYVLRHQSSFDTIRLSDDLGNHWKIPVSYILESGEYLHFQTAGFELQRFVSLQNLEQFRVHKKENRRF